MSYDTSLRGMDHGLHFGQWAGLARVRPSGRGARRSKWQAPQLSMTDRVSWFSARQLPNASSALSLLIYRLSYLYSPGSENAGQVRWARRRTWADCLSESLADILTCHGLLDQAGSRVSGDASLARWMEKQGSVRNPSIRRPHIEVAGTTDKSWLPQPAPTHTKDNAAGCSRGTHSAPHAHGHTRSHAPCRAAGGIRLSAQGLRVPRRPAAGPARLR